MCFCLSGRSCFTQFKTARKAFSSVQIFSWLFEIRSFTYDTKTHRKLKTCIQQTHITTKHTQKRTSLNGKSKNSSVPTTCWKFCNAYLCDRVCSSLHECASAKVRMPKQFDGCSWRIRNLQHASRTDWICSRLEAGSKTYSRSNESSSL